MMKMQLSQQFWKEKKNWKLIPKFHIFPFMNEFLFILAKYKDDFYKRRPKSLAKTLFHRK